MRQDDPTIRDDDRLFRAVTPQFIVREADGTLRPSSAAFTAEELSVNIASVMAAQGRPPAETLNNFPGWSLTSITPGAIRRYDAEKGESHPVVRDADPPHDPAHGLVLGRKSRGFANTMTRAHRWIVPPS
jgi:hypothetical protein